ncbi:MAG TPA: YCF48-related protein [Pyrinomonadaceae bacterium]
MAFVDEARGWAAGGQGVLLKTEDGGAHWRTLRRPTEDALRDVVFVNPTTGWLLCQRSLYQAHTPADPRSYLLKTEDGGATWRRVTVTGASADTALAGFTFADEQHGWAYGEEGALYATADGGDTWTRQRVPTRHLLLGGAFVDNLQGWLVGAGATLLQATDGVEWRALGGSAPLARDARLNAVAFAGARRGWAVGARGLILATADGGRSWTPQPAETNADLFDVKFTDARTGWAAGADGTLLHTTDGGAHWLAEPSPTRHPLARLYFLSPARGWAVGFGGTIITYTPGTVAPPALKTSKQ